MAFIASWMLLSFKLVHAAFDKAVNDKNHKGVDILSHPTPDLYAQLNFSNLTLALNGS